MARRPTVAKRPQTALPAEGGSTAERLASLHRSSGTLAHDFNNLLGVILSANERLAKELGEGTDQQKLALLSLEAAERGADLMRRLLAQTHDEPPELKAVDCAEVLQTLRRLARQAIAPDVRLAVNAAVTPLACAGDRTGLEMALLNLCLNAGQATPPGGLISVQACATRLSVAEARKLGLACGGYVAFAVRDSGEGMSADTLARATDPLFTTKATGTGLGLSSVLEFSASEGGALALESCEGRGTTATLYLPLAHLAATAAAA
ncbi:ATP-binding protein [Phenylobacterium sp.]|uniref:ATP-binding protein n=1 Tax=Phenylobacterium sp. TaxID=1871053 RepID=UPI0035686EED